MLGQFERRLQEARRAYEQFGREGIGRASPWQQVRGQVYRGSEDWVAKDQRDRVIKEVTRTQTHARRPSLTRLFSGTRGQNRTLVQAHRQYGYRLWEIAQHWGAH